MASVVIHRYLKVSKKNVAISKAHIRYIQHRSGHEREREPGTEGERLKRDLFDAYRDSVSRHELNGLIDREPPGGVAIHKLTLSPGIQGINLKDYTREVMDELGREKGLDLRWAAAAHRNTDHDHVHVVILGSDANGRRVRLDRGDHDLLRYKSDLYLEREHSLDRELDREQAREAKILREEAFERESLDERLGRLLGKHDGGDREAERSNSWSKERALEEMPDWQKINVKDRAYSKYDSREDLKQLDEHLKTNFEDRVSKREYAMMHRWINAKERHGDSCFERWDKRDFDRKEKEEREGRDAHREWHELDKNARNFLKQQEFVLHRSMPNEQRIYEQRGRLTEFHCTYQNSMAKQELEAARARTQDPAVHEYIDRELAWRLEYRQEELKNLPSVDLDTLFGKTPERERTGEPEKDRTEDGRDRAEEKDHNRGQESLTTNEKGRDLDLTGGRENKPLEEQTAVSADRSRELTDAQHGQEMHEQTIFKPGEDDRKNDEREHEERER